MLNKGQIICLLVASAFEGECGPFAGEDPDVEDNSFALSSQAGTSYYTFDDTGAVDVETTEEGYDEETGDYIGIINIQKHYDSVLDLLSDNENGWFMYWDREDITEIIKKVLEVK